MAAPAVTYIIASTMRTGSYLLCEGLEATGMAGRPREIFCPERKEMYAGQWQLPANVGFNEFVKMGIEKGTTENGVFGTKIHAHHVDAIAEAAGWQGEPWDILRELFPNARYVHLRRRNRRAQAISWYRAEVTNEWWRIPGVQDWDLTGKKPEFDAREIRRLEIALELHQQAWDEFFAEKPTDVLNMDYETLSADYRGEVARVLSFIGQDPELAKTLPEPRMVRQSDGVSEEWERWMDEKFPRK